MIILSIDPGVEKTGYAVFKDKNYLISGLVKTDKNLSIEKRLKKIYEDVKTIILKYKPKKIIIEQLFFFKNQKTIIQVSQSQGIILLLAGQLDIKVEFLTPLQIKQIITGFGRADKKSVLKMITLTTNIKNISQDDEVDAIACGLAYCYLNKN